MQMMMAAWSSQTISAITRLGVPDLLSTHGALTARQLTETYRVEAQAALLERALRACASVGIFTESAEGRFGPTPLSEVLVDGAPGSVRQFVELIGDHLVKTIMHDWDDARCVTLLQNCRARLASGGRILGVDNVLPPMGDTGASGTKLLDMLMMVVLPGKERTEAEWRALYAAAGLCVMAITPINPRSVECLIEGVPA